MGTRTALFNRVQPGGVYTIADLEQHPGDIWFVDSGSGTDADGYGQNPDAPFATIDYAIGNCTASQGDVIYVMPGHAENITTATGVNVDVAGVSIVGLGWGSLKPTVSTTAAAGSITVAAANVVIRNLKIVANFGGGTATAVTIPATASDLLIEGCDFRDTSAANEFLIHMSVAAAVTGLTVKNCTLVGLAGTMSNSILFAGASTNTTIEGCYFFVDSSDSVVDHATAAAVNMRVAGCTIINQDVDTALYCIQHHAGGTGVVSDCRLAYNKVDAEVGVGAAAWWFETYATNTVGTSSGVLDPAAGAAVP